MRHKPTAKRVPTCAVYMVRCGKTFYVGSTTNTYRRKHAHKTELKHNYHNNPKLQAAYNESKSFECISLQFLYKSPEESVDDFRTRLRNAEQVVLDSHKDNPFLANQSTNAHGPCRNVKRYFSPEARARMSAATKGKKLSDEHRAKLSEAKKGENNPHARQVIITNPDGTETIFPTGTAAAVFFRVSQQLMHGWLTGKISWPNPNSRGPNRWIIPYSARFA